MSARAAERLRRALDMFEFGEQMRRARLRRQHPDASDDEIDAKVRVWMLTRPGAALGDSVGRPSSRFRDPSGVASLCWLFLRQGRFAEVGLMATRTADEIEPRMSSASMNHLATGCRRAPAAPRPRPRRSQMGVRNIRHATVPVVRGRPATARQAPGRASWPTSSPCPTNYDIT
ncbi:MAG TPA: hypothetical protein VFX70_14725 [Mycobacteriales bacterium]|nr:hypothetical protein [Mycobacteriales bacterium]